MNKAQKIIRRVRELDIEKQRHIKAERDARMLRLATLRWRQNAEPLPCARSGIPDKKGKMDMMINIETPVRRPEDLAGEGMWRMIAGERCLECWDELPESQKEWWRCCALYAVREWLGGLRAPM